MANLLSLKTTVRNLLNEATASRWTDADIVMWINEAERDIAVKSGCIESIVSAVTSPGSRVVLFTGVKVNYVEFVLPESAIQTTSESASVWADTADTVWLDLPDTVWEDNVELTPVPAATLTVSAWADTTDNIWMDLPDTVWADNIETIPTAIQAYFLQRTSIDRFGHIGVRQEITPQYYTQWGDSVLIEPIPEDTYSLNIYLSLYPSDQLSDDSDTPEIPLEFQECIPPYVCSMAKFQSRNYAESATYYSLYITNLQLAMDGYESRQPTTIRDIRTPTASRQARQGSSL